MRLLPSFRTVPNICFGAVLDIPYKHRLHQAVYEEKMDISEVMKRVVVRENIESQYNSFIEEKIDRYLEIEHQGIIGAHYFAPASSECIYLYRDGYFIGAVMMSHSINDGIIKFVAESNCIERYKTDGATKTLEDLIHELRSC